MIYVLNKNKMFSYLVASFIIIALFTFSTTAIPNGDIHVVKVSSNAIKDNNLIIVENNN